MAGLPDWCGSYIELVAIGRQLVRTDAREDMAEPTAIVSRFRPRVLTPGLPALDPGVERHLVRGGGLLALALEPDDHVELVDLVGGQACEVAFFAKGGADALGALGLTASGEPAGIRAILSGDGEDAQRVRAGLARRGLELGRARCARLLGPETSPGAEAGFRSGAAGFLVVAAPGGPMSPWEQDPPTDLLLFVRRAALPPPGTARLPEPLADPRLDLHVAPASVEPYVVRAGEYIQIIDIQGRQCSDFLAFQERGLERGAVRGLDNVTTRTLLGTSYPKPGLYSKFFDADMNPLVEVVQDTVGRHDSFNLACTARYYEDQGYFGHPNCSDNFSRSLEYYGIGAQKGWPAINLFFNTHVDAHSVITFDEPWSRPGDYVLLRALTDLVCASSACPCDIDPANGWVLTDIQVRVYPERNLFKRAVAYRMTPDAPAELTKETGFHPRTSALTRDFAEYRGYWLPTTFARGGPIAEYWACRERCVVTDLSALRKFEVLGPDAETLLQRTLTRNVRKLGEGQVVYSALCHEHGGMIDDGTLFRHGPNAFRWIGGDDLGGVRLQEQAKALGLNAHIKPATAQIHNIAVQGPRSRAVLAEIVWTPPGRAGLTELGWFRFTIGRIGGFQGIPVVVSRTGYTGELGYEVFCHPKDAPAVWDAVMRAGEPFGIEPMGLAALDMVRIEAGLAFAGHEFDGTTDPFEAGIGFVVAEKNEGWAGKEALARRKAHPRCHLVGLELAGNEVAAKGEPVFQGRAQVGQVTSAMRSPVLERSLALARVDVACAGLGTELEIGKLDGLQKRLPATVVRFPFYDPEKTRVRA
jgi:aminomethyltransferase